MPNARDFFIIFYELLDNILLSTFVPVVTPPVLLALGHPVPMVLLQARQAWPGQKFAGTNIGSQSAQTLTNIVTYPHKSQTLLI